MRATIALALDHDLAIARPALLKRAPEQGTIAAARVAAIFTLLRDQPSLLGSPGRLLTLGRGGHAVIVRSALAPVSAFIGLLLERAPADHWLRAAWLLHGNLRTRALRTLRSLGALRTIGTRGTPRCASVIALLAPRFLILAPALAATAVLRHRWHRRAGRKQDGQYEFTHRITPDDQSSFTIFGLARISRR